MMMTTDDDDQVSFIQIKARAIYTHFHLFSLDIKFLYIKKKSVSLKLFYLGLSVFLIYTIQI